MWASRPTRRARLTYQLTLRHGLTDLHLDFGEVRVSRRKIPAMLHHDGQTVPGHFSGGLDDPLLGGEDVGAHGHRDVGAGVELRCAVDRVLAPAVVRRDPPR